MFTRCLLLGATLALLTPTALAQESLPQPQLSPAMGLTHTLGLTNIELKYGAPSLRGRTMFGDKIPYGVVWRAGANATTRIHFTTDVLVEGEPLAAGSYGLHMAPGVDAWTVVFNSEADAWGSYNYDPALNVLKVSVSPREAPQREQLRYAFDGIDDTSASLVLAWERVEVPVRVAVDIAETVFAVVRSADANNDTSPGWEFWSDAAELGRKHGVSSEERLEWLRRSIAKQPTFINQWAQLELLSESGDTEAAARGPAVLAEATLEDLQGYAYRYHQRGNFKMSAKFFGAVVAQRTTQWWPYSMLAKAHRELGDTDAAIEALRGALAANPDRVSRAEFEAMIARLEAQG